MDRANYELARHLAEDLGATVHLVAYFVSSPLAEHPNVVWHRVRKPLNADLLAEPLLAREGRRVARELSRDGARIVVNGGNCAWPDVNWIHAVHTSWRRRDQHAPLSFRLRAAAYKAKARRDERRALSRARVVVTNSERARGQVIADGRVRPEQVRAIYYGIDPDVFHPPRAEERAGARARLAWDPDRTVALFIGALGHDRNKGFDLLFAAWEELCRDPGWDVDLAALGGGAEVAVWQARAEAHGLGQRVRMLGRTKEAHDLLLSSDLLLSPTHYEAYGLGVHEALCCGIPAFVTRTAGVAERYPAELNELLLDSPPTVADLVARLRRWHQDQSGYQARLRSFSDELRQRTWADMARDMVAYINEPNGNQ